jgi:hypothetical protein
MPYVQDQGKSARESSGQQALAPWVVEEGQNQQSQGQRLARRAKNRRWKRSLRDFRQVQENY